jgi:hypothetical protein
MSSNRWTRTSKKKLFVSNLSFIEQFTLTLWNPTIHSVVQHARVPVRTDYTVIDPTGQTIPTEVLEKKTLNS